MPAPGQQSLGLHPFDHDVKDDVFVAGRGDLPLHTLAGRKGFSLERHAEPIAEFLGIRQCAPGPRTRRFEQDISFNWTLNATFLLHVCQRGVGRRFWAVFDLNTTERSAVPHVKAAQLRIDWRAFSASEHRLSERHNVHLSDDPSICCAPGRRTASGDAAGDGKLLLSKRFNLAAVRVIRLQMQIRKAQQRNRDAVCVATAYHVTEYMIGFSWCAAFHVAQH